MFFTENILINPNVKLQKGKDYSFIEMADVACFSREPNKVVLKKYNSGVKFEQDDTVIARIEPCLQNGKSFYAKNIKCGFGSTEFLVFRPKNEKIDSKFLYYYLHTNYIRQIMISSMTGATGRQRVNNDIFESLEIELPDEKVQKRIGEILFTYDDLIENNQKQIKLLEEAAIRIYKEWFVHLRFPGHEATKIIDGAPEGWKKVLIKKVTDVVKRGISPNYSENGTFVINQKCIRGFVINNKNLKIQNKPYSDELKVNNGDILICSTGTGTVGRVSQFPGGYECTIDSHVTLVRTKNSFSKNYLFLFLYSNQSYLASMAVGSTNQVELAKSSVENIELIYPSSGILNQFENIVEEYRSKINLCTKQIEILKQARDDLLPKLMSGQIKV